MLWNIQFFPRCTHHIFLSHCAEDRRWLVSPLVELVREQGINPWVDWHDYPYGRTSFEALRDGIIKSRHVVFLITTAMLVQARGWTIVELAWADLLQANLREPGGTLQTIPLPLFFLDRNDERLLRSAWLPMRDRGIFHRPEDGDALQWASRQIGDFVLRETQRGLDNARWLQQDSHSRQRLANRQGLIDRIKGRYPTPLAPV